VGTGFHPELSGRENIYLNGAILGMRKAEIKRKFDEIVDFSGVERYIDTPVKRYSSGMYVRLAFAVAAHLESEILIVDEVLAVGDAEFQKKCLGKMGDVSKGEGRTILFVSHNMGSIAQLCSKGILLTNGEIHTDGAILNVIKNYMRMPSNNSFKYYQEDLKKDIYISEIIPKNSSGEIINEFRHDENILFEFKIAGNDPNPANYKLIVLIQDEINRKIFSAEQTIKDLKLTLTIEKEFLTRGTYSLNCIIYIPGITQYDYIESCCSFSVTDAGSNFSHLETFDYGTVFGKYRWE
jgi:lipopolysaccharide transport system ATP-binding protein